MPRRQSIRHQNVLRGSDALDALRNALGHPGIEVYAMTGSSGSRYLRIVIDDEDATFSIETGRRMKNSRGLTRHDRILKRWLGEHIAAFQTLYGSETD